MSGGVVFEFDKASLSALMAKLDPAGMEQALQAAAADLALIAERAAKEATPVVTGHARRSTVSDVSTPDRAEVQGRYPYVNWLDTGEDSRGRKMRTRAGGYGIRSAALDAAKDAAPKVLDKVAREVLAR